MRFFETLRASLYDPEFYAGMRERSWSEAAKYYLVIAFVVIFAYVAPVWGLVLTVKPELVDTIVSVYPDELEVTFAYGAMSINQPEPYAIKNTFTEELPENLAVFDTRNDDYSPTSLDDARTLMLFKRTFAVIEDSESGGQRFGEQQRMFSYGTSTGTSTLTKAAVVGVAEKIKPYIRPVAIIGGAFLFVLIVLIGGTFMLLFHLLYTVFAGLLVYAYFKFAKREDSYTTAYTTALFASLPVAIVSAFAFVFGGLPVFTYTLLIITIVVVNISKGKTNNQA